MVFQVQISKHLFSSYLIIGALTLLTVFGESLVPIADSKLKPQLLDCSSPKASIDFLKAIARSVSVACHENNDRDFWEAACKCAVNRLPDSLCPKCRRSRAVEVGHDPPTKAKVSGINSHSVVIVTHFNGRLTTSLPDKQLTTPEVVSKSTTERILLEQRLPAAAQATHSASANFIRFGK